MSAQYSSSLNLGSPIVSPADSESAQKTPGLGYASSRMMLGLLELARVAESDVRSLAELNDEPPVASPRIVQGMLAALHLRDRWTLQHVRRVARLVVGLARHLGWDGRKLQLLETAALLHDIGKIGIPDNLLFKPGRFSAEEIHLMSLQNPVAVDVLQACQFEPEILDIIRQSKRSFSADENGYARAGSEMHLGARILAVADAYDSLRHDQVFRPAKSHDEVLELIAAAAGTQYDGNVVRALQRWLKEGGRDLCDQTGEYDDLAREYPAAETVDARTLGSIFQYIYTAESLYDGLCIIDADLHVVVWNQGMERLTGRTAQESMGRSFSNRGLGLVDRNGQPLSDAESPVIQSLEQRRGGTSTQTILRDGNRRVPIEMQTIPLFDSANHLHGAALILRRLDRTDGAHESQTVAELRMAASRDALTRVANRGELERQLAQLAADWEAAQGSTPFSVIFVDADRFKLINDTHGHSVGDQVLIDIASLLRHETYSGELVGRYGGEEFVVLCPENDLEQAVRKAERLRMSVRQTKLGGSANLTVTASFGVAQMEPGDTAESVLQRADQALYDAKHSGRDRTCSLSRTKIAEAAAEVVTERRKTNERVFTGQFHAMLSADIVVYKLQGFVQDAKAEILHVAPERVELRLGQRGIWPYWGNDPASQPVRVELLLPQFDSRTAVPNARSRVAIDVTIRPEGWVRSDSAFLHRAELVLRDLRSYFAADLD